MTRLNRNIITEQDIANLNRATRPSLVPETLDWGPPAGANILAEGAQLNSTTQTADDYLTKVLKYVPPEVVGLYLFVDNLIRTNVPDKSASTWQLFLLIAMLFIAGTYVWRVLKIVRPAQIVISVVGLAVYAFALGGWFATMTWYNSWYSSIALGVFALLVKFVQLPPLPASGDVGS